MFHSTQKRLSPMQGAKVRLKITINSPRCLIWQAGINTPYGRRLNQCLVGDALSAGMSK